MHKPKILFLIRQLGLGGTERRMLDLAASLTNEYEIKIVAVTGQDETHNVDATELSSNNRKGYFSKLLFIRNNILAYKPALVHAFDADSGIYANIVLRSLGLTGIKLISGMGAEFIASKLVRSLLKWKFFQPDIFVCNSQAGGNFILSTYHEKIKVAVIPNGLNTERFIKAMEPPVWAVNDRPIIGYIGKMDQYKRGDRMVEIAALFENDPRKPLFVLIGKGEYLEACKQQISGSEFLKQNVVLLNSVDNAARLIQFFTIGILCSVTEGFPNVLLEYMAWGVPLVSTAVGDIAYITDEGRTGIVIDQYNAQKFADAIRMLLDDRLKYDQIAKEGKTRFEQMFTINIMKAKYKELYGSFIK
jgi:glycosyltransferase involved in cell wall biosynthesis